MTETSTEPVNPALISRPQPVPHDPERGGDATDLVAALNATWPTDFPQNNHETKTNKNKNRKEPTST